MSMKIAALFFLMAAFYIGFIDSSRPGYLYIPATRASYKYYLNEVSWNEARDTCRSEGSILFYAESKAEVELVLSVLGVHTSAIHTGLSDFGKLNDYKTLDGRNISEVYNNWVQGEPTISKNVQCVRLNTYNDKTLYVGDCHSITWPFICKVSDPEKDVVAAIKEIKTTFSNSSDKLTSLLERLAEAAANEAASSDRMTVNLAAVLERISEADTKHVAAERQTAAAIELIANHTAAAEKRIADAEIKQAASMQQLTAAIQQLTVATGLHEANQTTAMERQALALEKLASSEEKDSQ